MLTHVDLFSGIGGFALACRWAGIKTVAFCEIDPYCQLVLEKNFNAKVVADPEGSGFIREKEHENNGEDIRRGGRLDSSDMGKSGSIPLHPDIFTFDGRAYPNPFILTGGFPCQPFSCAGKRRGKEDDRHLWPQMLRVISEARPTWVIGENVGGIVSMVQYDCEPEMDNKKYTRKEMAAAGVEMGGVFEREGRGVLDEVMEDLCRIGYAVQAFIIPACACDAPHRRSRIWIVGHSRSINGISESDTTIKNKQAESGWKIGMPGIGQDVADSCIGGLQGVQEARNDGSNGTQSRNEFPERCSRGWSLWLPEPPVGRVAHGIPKRVDRLKSLGNAIVPQVAYEIIRSIVEVDSWNSF